MAGIDKLYGSMDQWAKLFIWLSRNRPQYCKFLHLPWIAPWQSESNVIANFPPYADRWLYNHCPLEFVTTRISEQYNGSPWKTIRSNRKKRNGKSTRRSSSSRSKK